MTNNLLVLQSDFGLVDGAVSAMIGVALQEEPSLGVHHLTHDITPYNTFEASYRLFQTVEYWPKGTTFVSVVDPGVGSSRKSVVALTKTGQYIVTPDNGTLSYIKKDVGIVAVREISEVENRCSNTELSYTFHGRDVYAYTGAKLASGHISFEEVGPELPVDKILEFPVVETIIEENLVRGAIDILDVRFGSLWTSITRDDFYALEPNFGDRFEVTIFNNDMLVYQNQVTYGKSFADVRIGQPIIYINSLYRVGLAINQGSFAKAYNVGVGHISFEEVGPELPVDKILEFPVVETIIEENLVRGAIDILDVRFGSLWTSITRDDFYALEPNFGDRFEVTIFNNDMLVYQNQVTYGKSFADVRIGQPIIYINSLYRVGLAINQGSFAKAYNVGVGSNWHIEIKRLGD